MDLQVRNDTNQTFYLRLWLTDTHLCGEWRSDRPILYTYQVYKFPARMPLISIKG
ncbi:VanW family protein [Thermacetogenium phaeum]|uniref:VanW family protein n=1 Tax=Thermacetogenium phaeum TaxID=85874 RepID=UPI001F36544A